MREKEPVAELESFELIADDGSVGLANKSTRDRRLKEHSRPGVDVVEEPEVVVAEQEEVFEENVVWVQTFPAHLVDCPTQLTLVIWICSMTNASEKYERTQQGNLLLRTSSDQAGVHLLTFSEFSSMHLLQAPLLGRQ